MRRLYPLTSEEQEFAAIHVDLVDKFLRYERLDPAEYYDIVIFGYLEAVQKQFRAPIDEDKQNFKALAKICMRHAVGEDRKFQNKEKRRGDPMSMDYLGTDTDGDDFSFHDLIGDATQATENQALDSDLITRILAVATPREREAIDLVCQGYETREIAEILGIARSTASTTLCHFRAKAKAVRDDREVIKSPQWARDKEKVRARNRAYQQAHRLELNAKERERYAAKRARVQEQEKRRPRCSEHQGRQIAVAI